LYLRFSDCLLAGRRPVAADAPSSVRLAHWRQPGLMLVALAGIPLSRPRDPLAFDSSILRAFDK
jgi:hypothetical protein